MRSKDVRGFLDIKLNSQSRLSHTVFGRHTEIYYESTYSTSRIGILYNEFRYVQVYFIMTEIVLQNIVILVCKLLIHV